MERGPWKGPPGASGLRVVSDARMESVHHGDPSTLTELFIGELWRGRDNLRVSFRKPLSVAALPSALIPVVDIVMLGVAMAASGTSRFNSRCREPLP